MHTDNTTAAAAAAGGGGRAPGSDPTTLRPCNISGCRVNKYVELSKRKCSQFVSSPYIMQKPLVVHGETSIFQVGGDMAKVGDIPTLKRKTNSADCKPIYRIKPGTHAHVIHYVFLDEGSDSMEKVKSGDQEAIRVMVESQRVSATAKLQKLITTHRGIGGPQAAASAVPATSTTKATPAPTPATTSHLATLLQTAPPVPHRTHVTTPQLHPNLSIASVEGARSYSSTPATAPPPPTTSTGVDNSVDKLQAELLQMRRTVEKLGATLRH